MTATHTVKTWAGPFQASWDGSKRHELREDDRGYREGDVLVLVEVDAHGRETGRQLHGRIGYVSRRHEGTPWGEALAPGWVVLTVCAFCRRWTADG